MHCSYTRAQLSSLCIKKKKKIAGYKESQFYSLPFGQA